MERREVLKEIYPIVFKNKVLLLVCIQCLDDITSAKMGSLSKNCLHQT